MRGLRLMSVLAVAAMVAASCGSDSAGVTVDSAGEVTTVADATTSTPPTTPAVTEPPTSVLPTLPASSVPPTTVPITVAPPITAGPTTTTPGAGVGFDPACTD